MSFSLPNPTSPTDGDSLLGTPIRQNFQAISTALQALDGTSLVAGSVAEAALASAIDPRLRFLETGTNFVYSGLNPSVPGSGFGVTIPAGTAYINGFRVVSTGTTVTVSASQDTYVDMDQNGAFITTSLSNNSSSPTLIAGRIRLMIIVSNATNVTVINQGSSSTPVVSGVPLLGADSLGNIIYPHGAASAKSLVNPYKFYVYRNAAWNDGNAAYAKMLFDTKVFDTGSNFDVVTNNRFVAPIAGFYQFTAVSSSSVTAANIGQNALYKNGSPLIYGTTCVQGAATAGMARIVSGLVQLAANDYIEMYTYGTGGGGNVGASTTYFNGYLVSVS